jgi:hypothetical protein
MDVIVPLVVFLGLGLLAITLCSRLLPPDSREWMRTLMLAALLLRLAAATAFVIAPGFRVFHEDASGYEYRGMQLASMWRGEYPPFPIDIARGGFVLVSGIVYYIFGRYQGVLSYFNCVMGTMLVYLVYRLAVRFFHPAVGRMAALLVGLMPSMVLWSSIALKDTIVTVALVVVLSSCVALKERVTLGAVAGIFFPIVAIYTIRFYMVYFVGFAIVVSLVLDRGIRFMTGVYKQIFVVITGVALFAMLGLTESSEEYTSTVMNLEFASQYRRGMAVTAQSGFDHDVDVSTPGNALAYLPIGMAYLLFAPFPWQLTSLRPLLAAPETVLWWILFPATVRGIILVVRKRFSETSALLIFSFTTTCVYSLIHGNVGSAFRQRAQILVFLYIFCAAGIYVRRLQRAGQDPMRVLSGYQPGIPMAVENATGERERELMVRGEFPRA